MQSATIFPWR